MEICCIKLPRFAVSTVSNGEPDQLIHVNVRAGRYTKQVIVRRDDAISLLKGYAGNRTIDFYDALDSEVPAGQILAKDILAVNLPRTSRKRDGLYLCGR